MKTLYANEIVLFSISWMYIFRNIFRKVYSVLHNWIEKGVTQTEVHYIKRKLMALQDLIDIIHVEPLTEKTAPRYVFSKRRTAVTFFVMASYDRLSVTVIIDGKLKDARGCNASFGKGGERKDKGEKARKSQ